MKTKIDNIKELEQYVQTYLLNDANNKNIVGVESFIDGIMITFQKNNFYFFKCWQLDENEEKGFKFDMLKKSFI